MRSPERVYALLVEANPIPDPQAVPPVPSPALSDERRSVMLTEEPTQTKYITARPRWLRAVGAFAAVLTVIGAGVVWAVATNGGPVAAGDARIEVTFTGDGTSYIGDREIIEGLAEVTVINETLTPMAFIMVRYAPGSDELAAELALSLEGGSFQPGELLPSGSLSYSTSLSPGSHTFARPFGPGTYLLDVAFDNDDPNYWVWRAAIIEVVSD